MSLRRIIITFKIRSCHFMSTEYFLPYYSMGIKYFRRLSDDCFFIYCYKLFKGNEGSKTNINKDYRKGRSTINKKVCLHYKYNRFLNKTSRKQPPPPRRHTHTHTHEKGYSHDVAQVY